MDILEYSHFLKIKPKTSQEQRICNQLSYQLIQWGRNYRHGQYVREPVKVFAAANQKRTEYRFHVNCKDDLIRVAGNQGLSADKLNFIKQGIEYTTDPNVELKIRKGWEARDYQIPVIDYIKSKLPCPNHLVTLSTGTGKSAISMFASSDIGKRVLYLIRPAFIDKWILDFKKTFELKDEDIYVVKGQAGIMDILAAAKNNIPIPKIVILSNKTYQTYLKLYEEYGEELLDLGYDCLPEDMYTHLGVGTRFIDEVHLDFHLNFKADMYTHVEKSVSMSASLRDSDSFIVKMYNIAYPVEYRYKAPPPKKYIEAKGVKYRLGHKWQNVQTSWRGRKEYSHGAYEAYIMKRETLLYNYLHMLNKIIKDEYIANYKEGDRLLVFCYSIEMATRMTQYLKEMHPTKTVERYVEDDQYANVMQPDIRVSTVLSAGTGIDIPKLKVAILTTAVASEKSNIQAIGRLRELINDDRPPIFIWLTCENIPKHLQYHEAKKQLFAERTLSVVDRYFDNPL